MTTASMLELMREMGIEPDTTSNKKNHSSYNNRCYNKSYNQTHHQKIEGKKQQRYPRSSH
jgi:hypothetical protein